MTTGWLPRRSNQSGYALGGPEPALHSVVKLGIVS
jgi:hypothetical protein